MSSNKDESSDTPASLRPFSPRETARALNAFLRTHATWGAWAQMASLQSAAFIGYALWLGVNEADIARFVSFASLATLAQLITSRFLVKRIKRAKGFIFGLGFFHILFRFLIGVVPVYLALEYRAVAIGLFVLTGIGCWHLVAPFVSEWQSRLIPEDIRARFLGRQTVAHLVAGIAASYLAGIYLDSFPEGDDRYPAFLTIFGVAALISLAGFTNLTRIPFGSVEQGTDPGNLAAPFRDKRFRSLLVFFLLWNFSWAIASPFYSVFMIQTLGISYTTIAILTSLSMGAMMLGSTFMGGLVDRFGSKAMLQVLVPPMIFTPLLWVFNRPDNYALIPVVMILNGLLFSGILVAVNALLFGLVGEEGRDRASYFASWSVFINLAYVVAPFLGSALVDAFRPIQLTALGFPIGNIQLVFLVSAAAMIPCSFFLRNVTDTKGTTPGALLSQVGRGNLLSYVYSSMVYERAASAGTRARAAIRMGRSRSPMALGRLINALDDPSPEVRRQAARGLGEARSTDAVDPLVDELRNRESDVRPEAAEALGRIGHTAAIDPLLEALDDGDARVCISAIRGLAEIRSGDVDEILFWKFAEGFNRDTFPTLADTLGRAGDVRITAAVFSRLSEYKSSAIRLQLLNSICRAVGDTNRFYQLVSLNSLDRAKRLDRELTDASRSVRRAGVLASRVRALLRRDLDSLRRTHEEGLDEAFSTAALHLLRQLEIELDAEAVELLGPDTSTRIGTCVLAIRKAFDHPDLDSDIRINFAVVCIACLARALERRP